MSLFNRQTITIMTPAETLNTTTGLYSKSETTSSIKGSIQPANPNELKMLPEYEYGKEAVLILTDDSIVLRQVAVIGGKRYRIIFADNFTAAGTMARLARFQAIGMKE